MAKEKDSEKSNADVEIIARSHRISTKLYDRISAEANKTGNAINGEINSLILDGLRFREAKVVIHLEK